MQQPGERGVFDHRHVDEGQAAARIGQRRRQQRGLEIEHAVEQPGLVAGRAVMHLVRMQNDAVAHGYI